MTIQGFPPTSAMDIVANNAHWKTATHREYLNEANREKVALALSSLVKPSDSLTTAEREILKYSALGYSNPEIASIRYTEPKTVEVQKTLCHKKFGFSGLHPLIGVITGMISPQDILNRIIQSIVENNKTKEWELSPQAVGQ